MKPSSTTQRLDTKALRSQLYELRREGFDGVDLAKLPDLTAIAKCLAPEESEPRRQLKCTIELAIRSLAEEQKTALLWFGLHPETRGSDKDKREEAAAAARFVSVPSFRSHRQRPLIESIAKELVRRYESKLAPSRPESPVQPTEPGSSAEKAEASPRPVRRFRSASIRRGQRRWLLLAELAALVLVIFGISKIVPGLLQANTNGIDPTKEVPTSGTVVSAEDGSVVAEPDKSPIGQLITEPIGGSFRACDVTKAGGEGNCKFLLVKRPMAVEIGDVLWIGRSLREQGEVPLPFVTLIARRRWENNHSAAAEMVIEWPGVRRGTERESDKIIFEMPGEYGYVNLVYVPGSTELRGPTWHDFIAHLPDGIMERGISLANLGPPVSCFECFDQYKRYVFFKARLEGHHSYED